MDGELFYQDAAVRLYVGDAVDVLRMLPKASVHCIVTSPPFWQLRNYFTEKWIGGKANCRHEALQPGSSDTDTTATVSMLHPEHRPICRAEWEQSPGHRRAVCVRCGAAREDRQYGLEPTVQAYIQSLRTLFRQLHRVLVNEGTVWLNIGDRYSTRRATDLSAHGGAPSKNLLGIPWRTALALQEDGWFIRNDIVWSKPNAMPESVRDRLSSRHEHLFLLSKQRHYWFDLDAIREPLARPEALKGQILFGGTKGASGKIGGSARRSGRNPSIYGQPEPGGSRHAVTDHRLDRDHKAAHARGRNPGDVWTISTRPLRAAHFAAFPIDIPLRCITAGCPPHGVVLDPCSGAATTALAARQLERRYIGIDLNPDFHVIGLDRLRCQGHLAEETVA